MTSLRGIELTPPLLEEVRRLALAASPVALRIVAATHPKHFPGGAGILEAARKQLAYLATRDGEIEGWVLDALRGSGPWMELVCVLSETALNEGKRAWAAFVGRAPWAVALLLDEREGVQALGSELAATLDVPEPMTSDEAREALRTSFRPLLARLSSLAANSPSPAAPTSKPEADANEAKRQQEALKNARSLEKETRKQKERIAHLEGTVDALKNDHKAEKDRCEELLKSKRALERALAAEHEGREQDVRDGVAAELARLARSWLPHGVVEPEATSAGPLDVIARAEEALRRQAEHDRHAGNRIALHQRLDAVRATRSRVTEAERSALAPLRELLESGRALDIEEAAILRRLGEPEIGSVFTSRLVELAASGRNAADILGRIRLVETLEQADLLLPEEAAQVRAELRRRFRVLADPALPGAMKAADRAAHVGADPVLAFEDAVDEGHVVRLVIDGHNLALRRDFRGGATSPDEERRRRTDLEGLVHRLADPHRPHLSIDLWFDGAEATTRVEGGVTVRFSGGSGPGRADAAILASLAGMRVEPTPPRIFVATSDRELGARARRDGAAVIPGDDLLALLESLPPR